MCGIAGLRNFSSGGLSGLDVTAIQTMTDALAHRGPDDAGIWCEDARGIAFGHRRLSVVDLTPTGNQPMVSASGKSTLLYNGEVYSHREIAAELAAQGGFLPRGSSDTEVILEACERWGVAATARRLIGMFAFAFWDGRDGSLTLVRDRLGIKPLYWARQGDLLLFGSELKALRAHPQGRFTVNPSSVASYLRFGYVPGPGCILTGVEQLAQGTIRRFDASGDSRTESYWSFTDVVHAGAQDRQRPRDPSEAVDALEALLGDAVTRRMIADVPVGAFLSGGVDSSTIVALMCQAGGGHRPRSFTIGFDSADYDESGHAEAVAKALGTEHTTLPVTAQDALDTIPRLADMFDEPFADSSQIPTYLVSRLTRGHVTVALSGDGGDELFAGYERYRLAGRLQGLLRLLPGPVAGLAGATLKALPPAVWDRLLAPLSMERAGDKVHKLASVLAAGPEGIYRHLVSQWPDPSILMPGMVEPEPVFSQARFAALAEPGSVNWMRAVDTLSYLPDDILTKVDRASMATALEARVPILDHRVVEFAWRLPSDLLIRDGKSKWLLRQVLYRHVPAELIERPKMGFGVPLDTWLRGPLRDWAEDLLDEADIRAQGLLDPAHIRAAWSEHLSGQRNWQHRLWVILMLRQWLRRWG